jgi:hypothetical protein
MGLERTKGQWIDIFLDQTDGTPQMIGERIIADLWGYNTKTSKYREQDAASLGNALLAYVEFKDMAVIPIRFMVVLNFEDGSQREESYKGANEAQEAVFTYIRQASKTPDMVSVDLFDFQSEAENKLIGAWTR